MVLMVLVQMSGSCGTTLFFNELIEARHRAMDLLEKTARLYSTSYGYVIAVRGRALSSGSHSRTHDCPMVPLEVRRHAGGLSL